MKNVRFPSIFGDLTKGVPYEKCSVFIDFWWLVDWENKGNRHIRLSLQFFETKGKKSHWFLCFWFIRALLSFPLPFLNGFWTQFRRTAAPRSHNSLLIGLRATLYSKQGYLAQLVPALEMTYALRHILGIKGGEGRIWNADESLTSRFELKNGGWGIWN